MKKIQTIIALLLAMHCMGITQKDWLQGIKHELLVARNDTSRVVALNGYCNYYKFRRPDSAMFYGTKALSLARQINYPKGELEVMINIALTQNAIGNHAKALQIVLQTIKIAEKNNQIYEKAKALLLQGIIYSQSKNYEKALDLCSESKILFDSLHDISFSALAQTNMGEIYSKLNQPDSALYHCQLSYDNQLKGSWVNCFSAFQLGIIQEKLGHTDLALSLFRESLQLSEEPSVDFNPNKAIAQIYQKTGNLDSCNYYAEKSLLKALESKFLSNIIEAYLLLSDIYEKRETQKALQYSKIAMAYKDSLYNLANKTAQETILGFDEQERLQETEAANTAFQNRLRMNAFSGITFTLLVIAIILFWNSRLKQKAKRNIERAYEQLKTTQFQLIQSEKMASLGELTAGIAHEIQNPLNFVNNFSEVNLELIQEMKEEIERGNLQEIIALANDILENQQKIKHHGNRADAIVKGMLQHSRNSSGIKEPTDINKLADEFLRLAYHGLQAKDKSFNVLLKTDFDAKIHPIDFIPQDIGRVLLNLFSNAFYAVEEKKQQQLTGYEPTVWVSTKKTAGKVLISVKDNGNGIPQKVLDKIFQPFFTTKPTGEGTGLGLSLSYDIVKAHAGELKVNTIEGEGSEFTVILPL